MNIEDLYYYVENYLGILKSSDKIYFFNVTSQGYTYDHLCEQINDKSLKFS